MYMYRETNVHTVWQLALLYDNNRVYIPVTLQKKNGSTLWETCNLAYVKPGQGYLV